MNASIKGIGTTVLGQTIDSWEFKSIGAQERILIVGGVHGDEGEGILIANSLIKVLIAGKSIHNNILIVPCLNKDGETLSLRSNFNDVDLNRNLPTDNWVPAFTNPRYKPGIHANSEPETKAFMKVVQEYAPTIIISLHSFSESLILYNKADGRFDDSVQKLANSLDIKIVDKMNYEVVGSLNTYSRENNIPTLTIEAPRDHTWESKKHVFIDSIFQFVTGI